MGGILSEVWRTVKGLVTRQVKAKGLAGPVGIVSAFMYSLRVSFTSFLWWAGLISLNLAIVNLLPIPVVDGGHIMFALIEKARRKPVRERTMAILINVFVVLIIVFFLYVTFNDVKRWGLFGQPKEEASDKAKPGETAPSTDGETPSTDGETPSTDGETPPAGGSSAE
jgi:regulator of sigma E protease